MSLATAEPLIRFVGVTKIYGHGDIAYQALKGIDLEVAAGDFVAIMVTTAATPMTMPRTVRNERIKLRRISRKASRKVLSKTLFMPFLFGRVRHSTPYRQQT